VTLSAGDCVGVGETLAQPLPEGEAPAVGALVRVVARDAAAAPEALLLPLLDAPPGDDGEAPPDTEAPRVPLGVREGAPGVAEAFTGEALGEDEGTPLRERVVVPVPVAKSEALPLPDGVNDMKEEGDGAGERDAEGGGEDEPPWPGVPVMFPLRVGNALAEELTLRCALPLPVAEGEGVPPGEPDEVGETVAFGVPLWVALRLDVPLPQEEREGEKEALSETEASGDADGLPLTLPLTDAAPRMEPLVDALAVEVAAPEGNAEPVGSALPLAVAQALPLWEGELLPEAHGLELAVGVALPVRREVGEAAAVEDAHPEATPVAVTLALDDAEGKAALRVTLEEGELEAHTEAVRDTDAERDCRPAGEGVLRTAVPEALGEGERECVGVPDCDGEVLREAVREAPDALPPKRDAVGDMLAERDTDTEPVEEADWESQ